MSEVMTPELASLMDLAEVVSVVESLKRRVLGLQQVITDEQRRRRDLMASRAVEQVQFGQLAARVEMLETSMAPPWTDADELSAIIDPPDEGPTDMAGVRAACQEIRDLAKGNGHG